VFTFKIRVVTGGACCVAVLMVAVLCWCVRRITTYCSIFVTNKLRYYRDQTAVLLYAEIREFAA
jgi:hypothetical protein